MILKIFTDGGSLGNPGPSASAYVIYQGDKLLEKGSKHIGHATNNFAEYTALILALEKVKQLIANNKVPEKILVFADSQLLVNQLNGLYKVKNSDIRENIMKIRILESEINIPIQYEHVYREQNTLADSLVKKALKIF